MRTWIRALVCALWVGLIAGCGGGGGGGGGFFLPVADTGSTPASPTTSGTPATPSTPATPTAPAPAAPVSKQATLQGRVTLSGAPVAGAQVQAGDLSATTDADGRFRVDFADPPASVLLLVRSAGRLTMAKSAGLAPGQTTTQDVALQAADVQRTFLSADGVIAVVNGAVIDIPTNAIQDASGAPYTGPVVLVASYRNPTTAAGVDAFPQPYEGDSGGTRFNLQTVGVIEATLATPDGRPLQLRQPATLVYPGVSAIDRGTASIPLWYYDEARALWVREGDAARQTDGSYLGNVSHFTAWNLDVPWGTGYTGVTLNYCVSFQNAAASRYGVLITVTGPGFNAQSSPAPLVAGTHQILNMPANVPLTVSFTDVGSAATQSKPLAPAAPGTSVTVPCVELVGSADYVAPPPPPPPAPVAADTPVNALQGSLIAGWAQWGSDGGEAGWISALSADAAGAITGQGGFNPSEDVMASLTGQMAVGGYFTLTATRSPGGTAPPNGPVLFTGRVYIDPISGGRLVRGVWSYANPPAGVSTPPNARFSSQAFQPA